MLTNTFSVTQHRITSVNQVNIFKLQYIYHIYTIGLKHFYLFIILFFLSLCFLIGQWCCVIAPACRHTPRSQATVGQLAQSSATAASASVQSSATQLECVSWTGSGAAHRHTALVCKATPRPIRWQFGTIKLKITLFCEVECLLETEFDWSYVLCNPSSHPVPRFLPLITD